MLRRDQWIHWSIDPLIHWSIDFIDFIERGVWKGGVDALSIRINLTKQLPLLIELAATYPPPFPLHFHIDGRTRPQINEFRCAPAGFILEWNILGRFVSFDSVVFWLKRFNIFSTSIPLRSIERVWWTLKPDTWKYNSYRLAFLFPFPFNSESERSETPLGNSTRNPNNPISTLKKKW